MSAAPIIVHDRYTQSSFEEAVYGEGALRFAYATLAGRVMTRLLFARAFVSRLFGWYMRLPGSRSRILPFIRQYGLDPNEFARPPESFTSFNDFFCRELRVGARPVDASPESVVFPADGRHFGWQVLGEETGVFVKGQRWDLTQLLGGDKELARQFSGGTMVLSRLCPVDYHHFHFPVAGVVESPRWHGNKLFSVSPIALRRNLSLLWSNKRALTLIRGEGYGLCCFIEIGATNVGSIKHRPRPRDGYVNKGDPKGWFEFGGSSVITLFEKGRVRLSEDLLENTARGVELYARVGDQMGKLISNHR